MCIRDRPTQLDELAGATLSVGSGLPFNETVFVLIHEPVVPTTVYVILDVGFEITEFPVVLFKSVAGLHEYELAPVAVKVDDLLAHIEELDAETLTTGLALTVMVLVAVFCLLYTSRCV